MKKIYTFLPTIALVLSLVLYGGIFETTPALAQTEEGSEQGAGFSDFNQRGVTQNLLNEANPLRITNAESANGENLAETLSTPGGIIGRVLVFAFPLAGLILFVMIIWGGFEIITQAAGKKSLDAGKQRITAALIGFFLLFTSYWIVRIIETVFGIRILF